MRRSLTLPALLAFAAAARSATAQEVIPYDPLGRPPPVVEPSPPPLPEPSPPPRAKAPPPVTAPLTPAPWSAPPQPPPQAPDPETPVPRLRLPPSNSVQHPLPPPGPPPSEGGLGAVQVVTGTLGMVLIAFPIVLVAAYGGGAPGVLAFMAGPSIGGLVVCGVGRKSAYYEGGCGPAILGAYLGAFTAIPLAYYGCQADQSSGGDDESLGCIGGLLLGFAAGYFIGTAVGATIGWHLGKTPRARPGLAALSAAPPPPPADDWPELRRRPAITGLAGREGPRVTVPLLALSF